MVRLEERPWRAQATLLLDTRARAHLLAPRHGALPRLGPAGDDCPPPDSLEWLIEAAASIGTTLAQRGAVLRAVTDTAELVPTSGRGPAQPRGPARPAGDRRARPGCRACATGVEQLCRAAGDGPVVCLLGAVGPDDVVELIRGRSGPTSNAGDPARHRELGRGGRRAGRGARPATTARGVLAGQREDAASLLRSAGWRVAGGRRGPVGRRRLVRPRRRRPRGASRRRAWGRRHERRRRPRRPARRPSRPCSAPARSRRSTPPPPGCCPWWPSSWSCSPAGCCCGWAARRSGRASRGGRPVPGRLAAAGVALVPLGQLLLVLALLTARYAPDHALLGVIPTRTQPGRAGRGDGQRRRRAARAGDARARR